MVIDIHTHADGDTFFTEDPVKAARTLLMHGVTDVLPALYFNMNADQLVEAVSTVRNAMQSGDADNIIGLYMESPYMRIFFS